MNRRTVLKRVGTAATATAVVSGTASASPETLPIEESLDVSGVSGEVPVASLLSDARARRLPDEFVEGTLSIEEDDDTVEPTCYAYCGDCPPDVCCYCYE